MTDPIALCLDGTISPQIALARLVLGGMSGAALTDRLATHEGDPRAAALLRVAAERAGDLARLPAVFAGAPLDHGADGSPAELIAMVAAAYDAAVARSPEASVAAYSLGHPATLAAATAEVVDWLDATMLLRPGASVVDVGCGIGRIAAALLPRAGSVLGLDISTGMVAEARRRYSDPRLRFEGCDGTDLDFLPPSAFDLVLAVDSFPYLVQAGTAARHVAGAARALRTGGALAILNVSYRAQAAADRHDAEGWAAAHGLALERAGETPFRLWDGTAWVLRARG